MTDSIVIPLHPHDITRERVRTLECEGRDLGDPWAVAPEPFDPRIRPGLLLPTIAQMIVCVGFVAFAWDVLT
ncbi:MAG: hypothetical protein EON87_13660 [Brevundimonas sp.]|nr:MAG: hypothetical protein EON87_13660 [Brevundimonas sp.]